MVDGILFTIDKGIEAAEVKKASPKEHKALKINETPEKAVFPRKENISGTPQHSTPSTPPSVQKETGRILPN